MTEKIHLTAVPLEPEKVTFTTEELIEIAVALEFMHSAYLRRYKHLTERVRIIEREILEGRIEQNHNALTKAVAFVDLLGGPDDTASSSDDAAPGVSTPN